MVSPLAVYRLCASIRASLGVIKSFAERPTQAKHVTWSPTRHTQACRWGEGCVLTSVSFITDSHYSPSSNRPSTATENHASTHIRKQSKPHDPHTGSPRCITPAVCTPIPQPSPTSARNGDSSRPPASVVLHHGDERTENIAERDILNRFRLL